MTKRRLISTVFTAGGIITILVMVVPLAFARSMAGMGDGTGSDDSSLSSLIAIIFICGYFFTSALGIFIAKTKRTLLLWAFLAHAMVMVAYLIFFVSARNHDPDGYVWLTGVIKLAITMFVYFLPGLILWAIALSSRGNALWLEINKKLMQ